MRPNSYLGRRSLRCALAAVACLLVIDRAPALAQVSLTGVQYTQDFNTLAITGTSSTVPAGWALAESGNNANATYTAGTGSGNAGDTYSFGAASNTERALGGLRSGALVPLFGAAFTNNTGSAITSLGIAYTGEQWRLGAVNREDRLVFQYSLDATSLTTGTWTSVASLDFIAPTTGTVAGALVGNADANKRAIASRIVGISVPVGGTFRIRWTDTDAAGADDGLAVDDFSLQANPPGPFGTASATPNEVFPADDVVLRAVTWPSGSPIASVIANLSAIGGSATQAFYDDGTHGDTTPNDNVYSLATTVAVATTLGVKTMPVTITDAAALTASASIVLGVTTPTCSPTRTISEIQGAGLVSPFAGVTVTTQGVVYARRSNGFYVQSAGDGNPQTSDGVFVFTSSAPTERATVGNLVCVSGQVVEFVPAADLNQPPLTEIGSATYSRLASGQTLPAPVEITAAMTTAADAVARLEALEGMRVTVGSLTVVGPTGGSISEPPATASSNGVFHGVVTGVPRPFREPGIDANDPVPTCAAGVNCSIPIFDTNPERLRVASTLLGTAALNVSAGTVITGLTGPLDYGFRTYTIGPESTTAVGVSGGASVRAVPPARAAELTVGAQNLQRFFNDIEVDETSGEPVLQTAAYQRRLAKASSVIRTVLGSPDVIGLVEIENQATLNDLAARINQDTVDAGFPDPQYVGYLEEGNDIGGIDVAFMVKARITVLSITQYGKGATFVDPSDGSVDILNDRPPLVLEAMALRPNGDPFQFTVIANHLRSLNDVDTIRVQTKRASQAEFLANLVQNLQTTNPEARILLVGDFNAFDFNDGYADVMGTITGLPAEPEEVAFASPDLVNPNLTDVNVLLPEAERYSYTFDGNAQTLDHSLASAGLLPWVSRFAYGRSDADFPTVLYQSTGVERLSDHDGEVTYIDLGTPAVTGKIIDADRSPSGQTWVDIELTNRGDGFVGDVVITELRFSALKKHKPVVVTVPVSAGALAPGETRVLRVYAELPNGNGKFNVQARGSFTDQQGNTRVIVITTQMFK